MKKVGFSALTPMFVLFPAMSATSANDLNRLEGFPAENIPQLVIAYDDFKEHASDLSCFEVVALKKDTGLVILFHRKVKISKDGRTAEFYHGAGTCGYPMAYEFSMSGELIGSKVQR